MDNQLFWARKLPRSAICRFIEPSRANAASEITVNGEVASGPSPCSWLSRKASMCWKNPSYVSSSGWSVLLRPVRKAAVLAGTCRSSACASAKRSVSNARLPNLAPSASRSAGMNRASWTSGKYCAPTLTPSRAATIQSSSIDFSPARFFDVDQVPRPIRHPAALKALRTSGRLALPL